MPNVADEITCNAEPSGSPIGPVARTRSVLGAPQQVATLANLTDSTIPAFIRIAGMSAICLDTGLNYTLNADLVTWTESTSGNTAICRPINGTIDDWPSLMGVTIPLDVANDETILLLSSSIEKFQCKTLVAMPNRCEIDGTPNTLINQKLQGNVIGTVDLTTLTYPTAFGTKTMTVTCHGVSTLITFASPSDPADVISQINSALGVLGVAALAPNPPYIGTNFLSITDNPTDTAELPSTIIVTNGTLAVSTLGLTSGSVNYPSFGCASFTIGEEYTSLTHVRNDINAGDKSIAVYHIAGFTISSWILVTEAVGFAPHYEEIFQITGITPPTGSVDLTTLSYPTAFGTKTISIAYHGVSTTVTFANPANATDVISQINTAIPALGTASLSSSNYLVLSDSTGGTASVTNGTLAAATIGFTSAAIVYPIINLNRPSRAYIAKSPDDSNPPDVLQLLDSAVAQEIVIDGHGMTITGTGYEYVFYMYGRTITVKNIQFSAALGTIGNIGNTAAVHITRGGWRSIIESCQILDGHVIAAGFRIDYTENPFCNNCNVNDSAGTITNAFALNDNINGTFNDLGVEGATSLAYQVSNDLVSSLTRCNASGVTTGYALVACTGTIIADTWLQFVYNGITVDSACNDVLLRHPRINTTVNGGVSISNAGTNTRIEDADITQTPNVYGPYAFKLDSSTTITFPKMNGGGIPFEITTAGITNRVYDGVFNNCTVLAQIAAANQRLILKRCSFTGTGASGAFQIGANTVIELEDVTFSNFLAIFSTNQITSVRMKGNVDWGGCPLVQFGYTTQPCLSRNVTSLTGTTPVIVSFPDIRMTDPISIKILSYGGTPSTAPAGYVGAVATGTVDLTTLSYPTAFGTNSLNLTFHGHAIGVVFANPINPAAVVSQINSAITGYGLCQLNAANQLVFIDNYGATIPSVIVTSGSINATTIGFVSGVNWPINSAVISAGANDNSIVQYDIG